MGKKGREKGNKKRNKVRFVRHQEKGIIYSEGLGKQRPTNGTGQHAEYDDTTCRLGQDRRITMRTGEVGLRGLGP
jgi:hypothetical protein